MRNTVCCLGFMLFFCGCTTLHYPSTLAGRTSIEQALRWQAAEESSAKIALLSNTAQEMAEKIRCREYELERPGGYKRSVSVIRKEIDEFTQRLGMLGAVENSLKKLELSRVFVEIECAPDRQYIYRYLVEKSLKARCIKVTDNEDEADYRLQVLVCQDGVDRESYNFLFLYWCSTLRATSAMNVVLTDRKKNIVVYEDTVQGIAWHENTYFMGIGPLTNSSYITSK